MGSETARPITCGSAIKLTHLKSKYRLNSIPHQWGGTGSGQQVVTLLEDHEHSTLWNIREKYSSEECFVSTPIKCGDHIRLTHIETNKNLHTHNVRSPLSGMDEVSAFEGEDELDDWETECDGTFWVSGGDVRFRNVHTGKYLGANSLRKFSVNNCGENCPLLGQIEVSASAKANEFTVWRVEGGIFLSK